MRIVFGKISFDSVQEKCSLCLYSDANGCSMVSVRCVNSKTPVWFKLDPEFYTTAGEFPNYLGELA